MGVSRLTTCMASLLAGMTSGFVSLARADEVPAESLAQLADIPLDQLLDLSVSGSSRILARRSQASAAVSIITRQEIRAYGFRTLSDALRSVRGLVIGTDHIYDYLGMRSYFAAGDFNTRYLLLIDGNRVNDHLYDQAVIGYEFPLDIDQIERIEFIPGQGSAVYGSNALFGVINVITREPVAQNEVTGTVEVGQGGYRRGAGTLNLGLNDGGLILAASRATAEDENLTGVNHSDYIRRNAVSLRWNQGGFSGSYTHGDRLKGIVILPNEVNGDLSNWFRDTYHLLNAEYTTRLDDLSMTQRAFFGTYRYQGNYMFRADDLPVGENRDDAGARWSGLESRLTATGFKHQQIVLGLEWLHAYDICQKNFDVELNGFVYFDECHSASRWALSGEDRIALNDHWTVHLGARLDHVQGLSSQLNPRLAINYAPNDQWVFKWVRGEAFRAPNAFESYFHDSSVGGYAQHPPLSAERMHGNEWIAEWNLKPAWRGSASIYDNHARQLIFLGFDDLTRQFTYSNAGSLHLRGAELELEHVMAAGRWRVNYSYNQPDSGSILAQANLFPRFMLKGLVMMPLGSELTLGVEGNLVGWRGPDGEYSLVNLTLTRELGRRGAELQLTWRNVLNQGIDDAGVNAVSRPVFPKIKNDAMLELRWPWRW